MSLRAKAAIVGFGEVPTRRTYPGRSTNSLLAESIRMAIADAGLVKGQVDGLITRGTDVSEVDLAEYMGLPVEFCMGITQHGASGAHAVAMAASAVASGLANTIVCVFGGTRDPDLGGLAPGAYHSAPAATKTSEWETPFGMAPGACTGYGLMMRRHMYEFGTTAEQFAQMAVNQRFNALKNPNAAFAGQAITVDDVLNSRMVNDPLHLFECVMPCAGAAACIVTSAERARTLPNPPVYILGAAASASDHDIIWQAERLTTSPVALSARRALEMSGYGPRDIEFAEFYD